MADELELDLDLEEDPNINRTENRIKNLSSKVKETATERDQAKTAAEAAEARADAAEKKAEFLDAFTGLSGKYPNATEHREAIQEKVLAGYSVEDATVSVLNAEGKLMPQAETAPDMGSPLGGSATTPPISGEPRPTSDMTREEKRAALLEADKSGELADALRNFR